MRVDAAGTLGLVEHRADDVARQRASLLERRERGDATVDVGAHVGRKRVEPFAKQLPLRAHETGDLGEPMTARVASPPARPPRVLVGREPGAAIDVVVDGEESLSHDGGFVADSWNARRAHEPCTTMRA